MPSMKELPFPDTIRLYYILLFIFIVVLFHLACFIRKIKFLTFNFLNNNTPFLSMYGA